MRARISRMFHRGSPARACGGVVLVALVATLAGCGDHSSPQPPDDPLPGEMDVVLVKLTVMPDSVSLTHAADRQGLTIIGEFTNSIPQDLTADPGLSFAFDGPGVAALTASRAVAPLGDGNATLTIAKGAVQTTLAVAVDICKPRAPALDHDIVFAFHGMAHVAGRAPGADRIRLAMPHNAMELPVQDGGFAGDVPTGASADDVSETWSVTAVRDACIEASAAAFLHVHEDRRAPSLTVVEPRAHASTSTAAIDVFGSVRDFGSGADSVTVSVNGAVAQLRAGLGPETSFVARGVALAAGANSIEVRAADAAGNTTVQTIEVFFAPPTGTHLELVGGNGQEAQVMKPLAAPLRVRVVDGGGQPVAGKLVSFSIAHSDGVLGADAAAPAARTVQSRTGSDGIATAGWQLGSAAGLGNNLVEARATGIDGVARFWASALPGPAQRIAVVDSMPAYAEAGAAVQERPRVWVNDGCNGVPGVSVVFRAGDGNGLVDGKPQVTRITDPAGYADVELTLGPEPGKQTLTAEVVDHPEVTPATIEAVALARRDDAITTYSGRVVSDSDEALGNATLTLSAGGQQATTKTAADGSFAFPSVVGTGVGVLTIDGTTVNLDGGHPIAIGSYPVLTYDVNVVPHADNGIGRPIFLPELRTGNSAAYSTTQPTVLSMAGMAGVQMTIAPGSMKLANGTVAPNGTRVSLNPVDPDRIPMPLPSGAGNPFAWTLQPSGARFDPPVRIQMPNASGLVSGTEVSFFSFDHDLGRFEMVARGAVSEDGATIASDPANGITKAGWGGLCPPYSLSGIFSNCGGLFESKFWFGVAKLGIQIGKFALRESGFAGLVKCVGGIDTSLIDVINEEGTCKKLVAAAQGVKDGFSNCKKLFPGDPSTLSETISDIADGAHTVSELIKNSKCFTDDGIVGKANDVLEKSSAFIKTGADVAHDLFEDHIKAAFVDAELFNISNIVCPTVESAAEATAKQIKQMLGIARTRLNAFHADLDALTTKVESFNEVVAPWAAEADEVAQALRHPELAGFEFSVGGQSALADADGSFTLRNIVARDSFGLDGPGTPRDFLSDDLFRVIGTRIVNGARQWAYSEFLRLAANKTVIASQFTISSTPPPEPDSISLTLAISPPPLPVAGGTTADVTPLASQVFTSPGQTGQLTATAALTDGTSQNVTPQSAGTTYRSSNPAIARMSTDGLVTARGTGSAFVTVSSGGASATLPIVVALGDPLTRVEGRVTDVAGTPVAGATVTTAGISGTSAADGSFALDGVPTLLGDILVAGRLGAASGSSLPQPARPGMITDVGDVVLGRRDSLGTDFLVLFEQNLGTTTLTLFISGPVATTGVAEIGSLNFSMPFTVSPGQVTSLTIPAGAANATSDVVGRLAVHVTASQEVAVYGLNSASFTTDAFLASPIDVLGTRYRVMSWPASGNGPSQFVIAATQDATSVTITPTATAGARTAGTPYTITLNALDTYQLAAAVASADLTGTLIQASAPIAVFAGNKCANIPAGTSACDHLTEQMPPVALWGSELLTVPLATRNKGDLFRILADQDGTQITIDGPQAQTTTLAGGQFLELELTGASRISASAPIVVGQYANSQGFDGVAADPMLMMLVPATEFARGYTFTTPLTGFATNFVNIVAPVNEAGAGLVVVDGKPVDPIRFQPLPHSPYTAAQIALTAGAHVVSSPAPIGVYVYGFATFNAYGYAGGFQVGGR